MSMSPSTIGIAGSLLVLAGWLLYRIALPKPIPGIPFNEEATKNIFGDVPSFMKWHAKRPELYTWISSQCVKHNSPVIQLFMRPFGKPWVILTDFREAQDIMARRTREFDRSDFFGDLFSSVLPHHHVHMPTGDEWKAHRRLVGDTMNPAFLNEVVGPQIYNTALDTIEFWKLKAKLAKGRPFPVLEDVSGSALDVIWSATFGSEVGTTKAQFDFLSSMDSITLPESDDSPAEFPEAPNPPAFDAIISLTRSVEIALSSPFPRQHHWFVLHTYPSLLSARRNKDKLIQTQLDKAWATFSQDAEKDKKISSALDLIVEREVAMAKKEQRPPQYDTSAIKDELFGFLVAGHDTTSITICWGLKHITSNQRVQDRLRSDLRQMYKRAAEAGENPTVEEITSANIPYLDAILEEISRVANTASSNMRRALCDTQVLGHHIPKGTDVFLLNSGPGYMEAPINVDDSKRSRTSLESKDRYGMWEISDIGVFMPERWLARNQEGEEEFNPHAGPFHAFGAGPRACFGRKLASLELKIIFTLVLWNFHLQPTPAELSSFIGHDVMTHTPQQCYLRLSRFE